MQGILDSIVAANDTVNSIVWGLPMMVLIVGIGVYLSVRTGFLQFKKFGYTMKNTLGQIFKKTEAKKGELTPFQALTTALAGTVGTGNIAGVAGAIALGGPGAIFWMWLSAAFGMLTKYAEIILALKYRERSSSGEWVGGPMYYIRNGLGKNWRWLSVLFSVFGALAAFGIGNIAQVNTIAGSVNSAIAAFVPSAAESVNSINLGIGLICAGIVGAVLIGGMKRIGSVTEKLIPFMSVVYIIFSLVVIISHYEKLGNVFYMILYGAFRPQAVLGGAVGFGIMQVMKLGVGRGVFSNEAGLGSAPIAHASSSEKNPVKQGLYGIFEVFFDTIVVCTLTALVILCSGTEIVYGNSAGVELTISAFATSFGDKVAGIVIAIGIIIFALSTILSWSLYGMRCAEYLMGSRINTAYQVLFIIVILFGATMDLSLAWDISDTLNGLMAIPNLIALFGLSGVVIAATKEYFKQREPQ